MATNKQTIEILREEVQKREKKIHSLNVPEEDVSKHILDINKIDLSIRPEIKPIINPYLMGRKIYYSYAKAKVGKTFWTMWNMLHISAGRSFHLFEVFQRKILYIDGEMTLDEMVKRKNKICQANNFTCCDDNFFIYSKDEYPEDFVYPRKKQFAKTIYEISKNFDVIVFDNLSSLFGSGNHGEKDDRYFGPMREMFTHLKSMGKTVWFIHHEGKTSETSRGSSNIDDGVDGCMRLEKIETENPKETSFRVNFRIYRSEQEERFKPLGVRIDENCVFHFFDPGKSQEEEIIYLYIQKEWGIRTVATTLGIDQNRVYRLLRRLDLIRKKEK